LAFVKRVVLVASAVMDAIAIDERELLENELAPGIVHVRLGHFHVHSTPQNVLPRLDAMFPLRIVTGSSRRKDALIFSEQPGRNCQRGTFIRRDFGMCSL